ncbi:MAG: hypothetical protein RR364_02135 [Lachnospiraceae bacterium]
MITQSQVEQLLKEIHVMVSKCEKVNENPNKIIMDKKELFEKLEQINLCMYDLMDQYEVTQQSRLRAQRELREQGETVLQDASIKAEDVYGAAVLYTDDAISRLIEIMESAQQSMELVYQAANRSVEEKKKVIRNNKKELQNQLFDMKDTNLYLGIVNERRQALERLQGGTKTITEEKVKEVANSLQEASYRIKAEKPEIIINQTYFDKIGKSYDTHKLDEEHEDTIIPEIKVDLDADYFKWKNGEENRSREWKKKDKTKS